MSPGVLKVKVGETWESILTSSTGGGGGVADVLHVGPDAPTDPSIELWADTDAVAAAPGGSPYTPLDQSSWAWVNQSGATVAQTADKVALFAPSVGSTNLALRVTTAPARPYTIELALVPKFLIAGSVSNLNWLGFVWRESATGKLTATTHANFRASNANPPPACWAANYNSATSWNGLHNETPFFNGFVLPFGDAWLRATDDGTTLTSHFSLDRITWTLLMTLPRTAFMAGGPDQVGIAVSHQNGSETQGGWIVHWKQT